MADTEIKCGKCGMPLMGKWPVDENGAGPCEDGADSPPLCRNPNVNAIHSQLFQATDISAKTLIKKIS